MVLRCWNATLTLTDASLDRGPRESEWRCEVAKALLLLMIALL